MKNNYIQVMIAAFFLLSGAGKTAAQIPATRIYDGEKLAKVKARIHSEEYTPAFNKLISDADKALKSKPVSVMDKDMVAASGDKHDYMSMGPYWVARPDQTGRSALYPQRRNTQPQRNKRPYQHRKDYQQHINFRNRLLFLRQREICSQSRRACPCLVPEPRNAYEPEHKLRSDGSGTQRRQRQRIRHD